MLYLLIIEAGMTLNVLTGAVVLWVNMQLETSSHLQLVSYIFCAGTYIMILHPGTL